MNTNKTPASRALCFTRLLALLPALGATQFAFCTTPSMDCSADGGAQPQADGAPATPTAVAQCANPGVVNTPCSEPVRCGLGQSCCGRATCVPYTQAGIQDSGTPYVWSREYCVGGPQVPPELVG